MEELYTGAIIEKKDPRDIKFEEVKEQLGGASPIDWEKGFIVPVIPKAKNQYKSSGCGGFACSYFMEVLSTIYDKEFTEKSAKFPYSLAKPVGSGGTAKTQLAKVFINYGSADESVCPSYLPDGTTTEEFISRKEDITAEAFNNAKKDSASGYVTLEKRTMDSIAEMIQKNNGCIIGIYGENNGTWLSEFPRSTVSRFREGKWAHWVYAIGFKLINGKPHIGIINSWGDVGDKGIQWLNESHIKDMWECWTFVYKMFEKYQFTQTLRMGMRNSHVLMLQKKLKELGFFPKEQECTGLFGVITVKAVRDFQKANGLVADGIVGNNTNLKLNTK